MTGLLTRCRLGRQTLWTLAAILAATAAGCGSDAPVAPLPTVHVDLARPFERASAEQASFDPDALAAAYDHAAGLDRILSLVTVRGGRLVEEGYFNGNARGQLNDVRSVTKSVVGLLAGIALRDGHLASTAQTLDQVLAGSGIDLPAEQATITVDHLLSMSGGWAWDESAPASYNDWVTSPDPVQYLLDQPLSDEPGTDFTYNSAAVHLLGVVLEEVTGQTLPDFAQEHLFGPLGIANVAWEASPGGRVNGGSGIDLAPRDLARLGVLMLQEGRSGDLQITPAGWTDRLAAPAFAWRTTYGPLTSMSYGGLWWTEDAGTNERAWFAWGFGGQFIYVVPSLDLVVVLTSDWQGAGASSGALAERNLRVVVERVVAAAR